MKRNLKEAIAHRRSYYNINNNKIVSEQEIKDIIEFAVEHVPSPFNSQSTRIVLLLNEHHTKLWDIVKNTLKKLISPENYELSEGKINSCFASGYGTILFYEDNEIVEGLQKAFPSYEQNFPIWSEQTSAMHQFAIWTMLEDAGLGATLQHYNPIIDEEIAKTWNINPKWKLIAQMPFGNPVNEPVDKEYEPLESRILAFM